MKKLNFKFEPQLFGSSILTVRAFSFKDDLVFEFKNEVSKNKIETSLLRMIEQLIRDFIKDTNNYIHPKAIVREQQISKNKLGGYADTISINRDFRYAKTMANIALYEMFDLLPAKGTKYHDLQANRMDLMKELSKVNLDTIFKDLGIYDRLRA